MERGNKYVWPRVFTREGFALVGYAVAILGVIFCFVHFNVKPSAVPNTKFKQSVVEIDDGRLKDALVKDSCDLSSGILTRGALLSAKSPRIITKIILGVDTTGMEITETSIRFTMEDGYILMPAEMLTNMIDNQYVNCVINKK